MNRDAALRNGVQAGHSSGIGTADGERKFVTIMFVDMAQSSRLVVGQDPEDADEWLLAPVQLMIDAVHRFGGIVNQVLGDGIMALFGAPRAQEDHALRACLAADAIHLMTRGLAVRAGGDDDQETLVRVGISSGEVVIRNSQGDFDVKLRATGEAVYVAQRLEAAAPPGATLLTRTTLALSAGAEVRVKPHGMVAMGPGGKTVEALQLSGVSLDRRRFQFLSSEGYGSFVGRNRDLRTLRNSLREIDGGEGRALIVSGEAGVGKSRLLFKFLAGLRDQNHQAIICSLLPVGPAQLLAPTCQVVRQLFEVRGLRLDGHLPKAVAGFLGGLEVQSQHAQAAILEILGEAVDDQAWTGLDPPQRRQIAVETAGELLCIMSRRLPMIIEFEDFHLADSETRLLADSLAEKITSARALMVVTCRSHHEKTWSAWPVKSELEIHPLSPAHTSELLESLLGSDGALEGVKERLAEKTQGNPFFIQECVRALDESGGLDGAPGAYQLAIPISELKIPATVQGVLAARIDSLPAPERATLLSASVIGERLDVGLLRDLEQLSRDDLMVRLSRLQRAGFIERTRIMPNLEYSFRHQLIHDVAYGTLLKRKRRELHGAAVSAIKRRRSSQLPGRIELLAHHAFCAEDWPRSVAYCRRAGLRAQAKSANREAVKYLDNALTALDRLAPSRRNQQRCIDLWLKLVQSLFPLGLHDQGYQQLQCARKLASDLGDDRRLLSVASALVLYHWIRGELEQAVQKGREALAMARRLQDRQCEMQLRSRLGSILLDRGEYESARKLLEATVRNIPEDATHDRFSLLVIASVSSRTSLARALGEMGLFKRAIKIGDEGIRISEETGHVFSQIYANLCVGSALLRKGDFQRSWPVLSRSFELCSATHTKLLYPSSAASLGYVCVRLGEMSRGVGLLESAASAAEKHTIKFQLSLQLSWLAEAYLLAGDRERALHHAQSAFNYARAYGEKGGEAWALRLLGEIYARQVPHADGLAEQNLLEAREIAIAGRMSPLVAHIDFGLGRLYWRRQASDEATRKMRSAVSRYRRLEMNYWLKQAEMELLSAGEEEPASLALT